MRSLVNPISLRNCFVKYGEVSSALLDISFVRAVIGTEEALIPLLSSGSMEMDLVLDRYSFSAVTTFLGQGERGLRLSFQKILPSARAHLRSFLSPRKIGESIIEDWTAEKVRHFHGLNESELWFNGEGGVLFSYLDPYDFTSQFIVHVKDKGSSLKVGKILRSEYIELKMVDGDLPLQVLSDKDVYSRLSECRDIITNFRPVTQKEYSLKQRLLKLLSDTLYSSNHRFEPPASIKTVSLEN